MSNKNELRNQRINTIINITSKGQEKEVMLALRNVEEKIRFNFPYLVLDFKKKMFLKNIVEHLKKHFINIDFFYNFDTSFITPDGGFLSIVDRNNNIYLILIPEVKNQGTNDLRLQEGLYKKGEPSNE